MHHLIPQLSLRIDHRRSVTTAVVVVGPRQMGRKNVMIAEPIVRKLHLFFLRNPKHNTNISNILEQISPHISIVKSDQFYYQLKLNFNIIKLIQKSIWFDKNRHSVMFFLGKCKICALKYFFPNILFFTFLNIFWFWKNVSVVFLITGDVKKKLN